MATSGRGTGMVGYNVQTAVDTKHHMIVAHEVTNVGHDRDQSSGSVKEIWPSGACAICLPTIYHWKGHKPGEIHPDSAEIFALYRDSLAASTRALLDHYELRDSAIKVVGVGSVGTVCAVFLLTDGDGNPLVLQAKEARASVLEAYAGKSVFPNHGQRVVNGQRLMQPVSDIFLGWTKGRLGRHYYIRQLRDIKIKFAVETFGKALMLLDAEWCGHTLALSHARSGDPALISGYLGKGDSFDKAIEAFSIAYADQNDKDYAGLKRAISSGKIKAVIEEPK